MDPDVPGSFSSLKLEEPKLAFALDAYEKVSMTSEIISQKEINDSFLKTKMTHSSLTSDTVSPSWFVDVDGPIPGIHRLV